LEAWIHPVSWNVVDDDEDDCHVCGVSGFLGSTLDVCPHELKNVLTVTWNGVEAVEVVVMGQQVEALRLEWMVEVVSHLEEDFWTFLWSFP